MYQRLWKAGEPVREQLLGALRPGEAQTLVKLLARVAEGLNPEGVLFGGSTSTHFQENET
jgi:hypothetical protein